MRLVFVHLIIAALTPLQAVSLPWHFAEGYSSAEPGGSALLTSREFTIYTGQDNCERSSAPASLEFVDQIIEMHIGDKLYRSELSTLIIEARDHTGEFLASVPIIVTVDADENSLFARSDWDYLEALNAGEGTLIVSAYCETQFPVVASIAITVAAD